MSNLDPLGINIRLYNQISEVLHQLETNDHVTLKERIAALIAIGRIQVIFMGLRKEKIHDTSAGSSVRKYATAFKANDARGRKALAGKRAEPEPTGDDDIIGDAINNASDDERDSA
jgi:hypothetical protein